jgi:hypothetical protein
MTSIEFAGILEAFMGDATVAITSEMAEAAAYLKASAELAITGTNPEAFRFIGFNALPTSAMADVGSIGFLEGSVQKWGSKLPAAILKDMGTTWGIGMAAGWDSDQMARAIAERFGLARASAMRLSRTAGAGAGVRYAPLEDGGSCRGQQRPGEGVQGQPPADKSPPVCGHA